MVGSGGVVGAGHRLKLAGSALAIGLLLPIVGWLPSKAMAQSPEEAWMVPVEAPVVDWFRPPETRFGAGNRGLEYATVGGEVVVAVADGVVTFAGQVGRHRFVVVTHGDGLRSTYGYLRSSFVVRGQRIRRGQQLAAAGAGFHLTARLGDAYVDPALLFAGAQVVLALVEAEHPVSRPSPPAGLDRGRGDSLAAASHAAGDLRLSAQLTAAAAAVDAWYREDCTERDTEVTPVGDGRILVQVAGLGSSSESGSIGDLDAAAVGYNAADIVGFSYAGGCTPIPFGHDEANSLSSALAGAADSGSPGPNSSRYDPQDTHQDINTSALRLADLIETIAVERPGQPIDIAAHSLGGIVSRRALEILDRRGAVPISTLITIASPHQGTDLATAAVATGEDSLVADVVDGMAPVNNADAVAQVAEAGEHHFDPPGPPPPSVSVVAIAGATDLIVPADAAIWDGAANVIIPTTPVEGIDVHSDLPSDPRVARELNLAIAGAAPSCVGLDGLLRSVAFGRAISGAEDLLGVVLGLSAHVL